MDPDPARRAFVAQSLAGLGALALPRREAAPTARPLSVVCVGAHPGEKKKAALLAHRRQHGEEIHRQHVEVMEAFRGREAGVQAAEAFVRVARLEKPDSL